MVRERANKAKQFRCKNLIVVLENPKTIENIGSTLRNIDAFGAEKLYVVDGNGLLPDKWTEMRDRQILNKISASAIKWNFVKVYRDTQDCLDYLNSKNFISVCTSPHLKGKNNINLNQAIFTQPRLAVWFGNESRGVSNLVIQNSKYCVQIPIHGIIESLNLGTSTGVVLYEITKQRQNFKKYE